jgi:UDP-N-acetylglucosamine--N-acetylmuramyl-(pentapeptide) pyrophosphoryl-undecaprenol N-acetylglucosamine transferase
MSKEEIRICLTGGATGGHFFPLVFVAREIKKIAEKENISPLKIFYLGGPPFRKDILESEGIQIITIPQVKLRKYFSLKNFIDLLKFPFSFLLAFYHLFRLLPNVVFSKGGPSSLSIVLAAWLLRIPIIIHESDSIPGLTNKISSIFAKKVALAFEEAKEYFKEKKVLVVGQPLDIYAIREPAFTSDYERFGLDNERNIVLFLGGSQGSQFLNDLVVKALPDLVTFTQVVHITGEKHYQDVYFYAEGVLLAKKSSKMKDYHPFPFISNEDLIILMKISDLIVSRAGSGSIFEIAAIGKPSLLIPIEEKVAGKHQLRNAEIYSKYGACKVLEEKNAKPHILVYEIKEILTNSKLYESMAKAALNFAKLDASLKLAKEILNSMNPK